jgi:uncharacterized protein involved in exopolysaccharide biosynthesis
LHPDNLKKSISKIITTLSYGSVIEDDPFTKEVKQVSNDLSLKALLDTYTFEIKYTSKDPVQAAKVANTTAKALIKFVNDLRISESRYQAERLQSEVEQARQDVSIARQHLEDFKKAHSTFLYDPKYDAKLKVISNLKIEFAKADAALGAGQNTLSTVSLAAKRARLAQAISKREAELVPMPEIERQMKRLEQNVKDVLSAYEIVDKQFKQADLSLSYTMPEVRLVSAAEVPRLPSSPRRGVITAISLLGGAVTAVGLAFVLEYLNRRIRSVSDIEEFIVVKVLTTIPRIPPRRHHQVKHRP